MEHTRDNIEAKKATNKARRLLFAEPKITRKKGGQRETRMNQSKRTPNTNGSSSSVAKHSVLFVTHSLTHTLYIIYETDTTTTKPAHRLSVSACLRTAYVVPTQTELG